MSIQVLNINKNFGAFTALRDVSLSIPRGEITALLGPSGSGKTTLLRIIAGLEAPDSGEIHFFGEETTHKQTRERKVGFVFQHYALFKHLSVFENVAFGLRLRPRASRPSRQIIKEKVMRLLAMVQLESMANRLPSELSGGQKQRVALARALAVEPQVLLLDEPFGALDAKVRVELRRALRYLHDEMHITSVFVTHDQEEALEVSDSIVILNKGMIEQVGTPESVYENPASPFVYGFLGNVNLFHARFESGKIKLSAEEDARGESENVKLFVRPHDITLSAQNEDGKGIKARVISARALGGRVRVELLTADGGAALEADLAKKEWDLLKESAKEEIYVFFTGARVYSNEGWSDWSI
ncbi:MAG: sulfate ABC transporter ATP-binding protein [Spirochaetaceae bacterium]|jgi:sulfate transport system ATP-binding protein|nr:sulfate ABC transporter ATP-binding protein [Spirochaetaceae bacterium]GMO27696.1 MAG: sulfate/molybdate ABC transporter ATP-binding protein [Termitinemataceae bacterium]